MQPLVIMWLIILIDFVVPFVPIMALFIIYVLIVKPPFFKSWIDQIYTKQ